MQGKRLILPAVLVVLGFGMGACGNTPPTSPGSLSQQTADNIAIQAAGSLAGPSGGLMLELGASAGSVPTNSVLRFRPGDPGFSTRHVFTNGGTRLYPGEPVGSGGPSRSISSPAAPSKPRAISNEPGGDGSPSGDPHNSLAAAETTFTAGSINYTVTRAFYDAGGNQLASYGPTATRLRITATANGSITTDRWSATVGRAGILDVTGIESGVDTLEFNGAGNDTVQCQFLAYDGTGQRYFYALGGRSLEMVQLLKNRSVNPYPLSGIARWAWAVDQLRSNNRGDVALHMTALVVVTFNGTASPEITVDGTYHYHVNLDTGAITRV
jgi:hypothetical protein